MSEFGEFLRGLRESKNLFLRDAASELGITDSGMLRIENSELTEETMIVHLFNLSKVYNESPKHLIKEYFKRHDLPLDVLDNTGVAINKPTLFFAKVMKALREDRKMSHVQFPKELLGRRDSIKLTTDLEKGNSLKWNIRHLCEASRQYRINMYILLYLFYIARMKHREPDSLVTMQKAYKDAIKAKNQMFNGLLEEAPKKVKKRKKFEEFRTKPYQHQLDILERCKDKFAFAFCDEMGTGKTKVAIDNIAYLYRQKRIDAVVITGPKRVTPNWINIELPKHLPHDVKSFIYEWSSKTSVYNKRILHMGLNCKEQHDKMPIFVINIESLITPKGFKYLDEFLKKYTKTMLLVDESTCIKNKDAKRTKLMLRLSVIPLYKRILTGAPIPKSPLDFYTQFNFLDPNILGQPSYYAFRNRYSYLKEEHITVRDKSGAIKKQSFFKVVGHKNLEELTERLKPHYSRLLKKDCLDLPEKIYEKQWVSLTPEQQRKYNNVVNIALSELEGDVLSSSNALERILRLHQIACGFIVADTKEYPLEHNRISVLKDILEDIPESSKVIIWATYIYNILEIQKVLSKAYGEDKVITYYGATNKKDRELAIRNFQDEKHPSKFFIGTPQTGGMGLTLTAANYVIYYSNNFDLEHRIQSEDRCHRVGQSKKVVYIDMVAEDTIDERIIETLRQKSNLLTRIMDRDSTTLKQYFKYTNKRNAVQKAMKLVQNELHQ